MTRSWLHFGTLFFAISAQAGDIQITLDRKKTSPNHTRGGLEQQTSQKWTGTLRVENTSARTSPDLQAKYVVIVKRQELAEKTGSDHLEVVKGEANVTPLKKGESFSADTTEIELRQQTLNAHYRYKSGGQTRASDAIAGVWVKVFSGTNLVAEYANPETVKSKFKWE